MTRRTPKPGDSYTKDKRTLVVEAVRDGMVYFSFVGGPHAEYASLTEFHRQIAVSTWGRP
jgi:hypothetical protein